MSTSRELELTFDSQLKRSEAKIVNPTRAMILGVLSDAGFDGVWEIRDSRRIRKKGRERFSAIRIESRAGSKSVRLWCKPVGNDTAFEYSLFPPSDVDVQMVFSVLKRVNPITLRVSESATLPMAVMGRVLDMPPIAPPAEDVVEVAESYKDSEDITKKEVGGVVGPSKEEVARGLDNLAYAIDYIRANPGASDDDVIGEMSSKGLVGANLSTVMSARLVIKGRQQKGSKQPQSQASASPKLWDLPLASSMDPSSQEAMDRVLVAIGMVVVDDRAGRDEAHDSIVRNLEVNAYATARGYDTLKGAIKALVSATSKIGGYLEKVAYEGDSASGDSGGNRSYKITSAGERRLVAIADMFGDDVRRRIEEARSRKGTQEGLGTAEAAHAVFPSAITRLKSLVASYEEAERQSKEIGDILAPMEVEIRTLEGDIKRLGDQKASIVSRIEELNREAEDIAGKVKSAADDLAKKKREMAEWQEIRDPYERERVRIGEMLSSFGGPK